MTIRSAGMCPPSPLEAHCRDGPARIPARRRALPRLLDHRGHSLAHAHAHGGQPEAGAPAPHLVHQGGDEAGAAGSEGMAEGDGPAVDVEPLEIDAEVTLAGQ